MKISLKYIIDIGTTLYRKRNYLSIYCNEFKSNLSSLKKVKAIPLLDSKSYFYYLNTILPSLYSQALIPQSKLEYNNVYEYKPSTD